MTRFTPPILFGLLALAGLAGCTTSGGGSADSAQTLSEEWRGQPVDAFFAQYGSPFAEYGERNGAVRYTWRRRYTIPSADIASARVCEIDLLADADDRIRQIVPTRNSKIRETEIASCEGVFDRPLDG